MVVEPASASDAAVRADHTADRRGQQLGKEEASSREERRQAVGKRGGKHALRRGRQYSQG